MPEISVERTREHEEVDRLLPWYANRTLAPAERLRVEAHLGRCAACRAELERCDETRALLAAEPVGLPAPHPAQIARLLDRLDEPEAPEAPSRRSVLRTLARSTPRAVRYLVLAQAALLALAVGAGLRTSATEGPSTTARFHTLSAAAPKLDRGDVRVVFAAEATEEQIRKLLLDLRAEIVAGPSPTGVYTLALPAAPAGEPVAVALELLRRNPRVRFAEPVPVDAPAR